jgi:transcriptional regulator with XRE-family HTH domain
MIQVDDLVALSSPGRRWSSRSHAPRRRAAIGSALAALRRERSIGLRAVVRATGISGRRIERIEAGADPSLAELRALLGLLDVGVGDLLERMRRPARVVVARSVDTQADPPELRISRSNVRPTPPRREAHPGLPARNPGGRTRVVFNNVLITNSVLGPLAA